MNWGVIGCANIAQRSVIPSIQSISQNKLLAVASRSERKAAALAQQFNCDGVIGYDELLKREDIEAVYIPLPTGMHYEWVMKSLEAGKHVLVEKSAFATEDEAKSAVELAKSKKLALVENFQFQHHSQHQYVKKLLTDGIIGEVRCFRSSFGFPPFDAQTNIRYKRELGGGSLLDSGAYTLKATSFLFNKPFCVKAAWLQSHPQYGVDWFGGAFLVAEDQSLFSEVAFGFDNYYQCNYEIWGSKGRILATRAFTAKPDFQPTVIVEQNGKMEEVVLPADDHFRNMLTHFNNVVSSQQFELEWQLILEQARLVGEVSTLAGS